MAGVRTHALLDALPVESSEKLPVLVLSHGFGGIPSSHTALLEDLASHGYVVLGIVPPYEATAATLADGQVIPMFDETGKPRPAFGGVARELLAGCAEIAALPRASLQCQRTARSADRRADIPNVAAQPAMSRIGIQPRVPEQ